MEIMIAQLRALWCKFWGGHNDLLKYSDLHLALKCQSCGRVTKGWDI